VRSLLLLFLLSALLVLGVQRQWLRIPPQWNPWAPLEVRDTPNWITSLKLLRAQQDPALCRQALDTAQLSYLALADRPTGNCPLYDQVRVQRTPAGLVTPLGMSCPLALAYALFERHGLQPAAQAVFGSPVVRVEHFGSFACRNIAGSSRRSQHASANALDLAAFRLQGGRRITVAGDWSGSDPEARFLREVHAAACRFFHVTLGPEYNAAHHDHFHVDMGLAHTCR